MTLQEVERLLAENNLPFVKREFSNEAAYWQHLTMFPYTECASECKVIALVIESPNGKKNIELQFNATENDFIFDLPHFGSFAYESFQDNERLDPNDLLSFINDIMSGHVAVIVANDIRHKRLLWDCSFDLNNTDDEILGKAGFEETVKQIQTKKYFIARLLEPEKQYEIYDWNSYQCFINW